jgi:hypothetical protein
MKVSGLFVYSFRYSLQVTMPFSFNFNVGEACANSDNIDDVKPADDTTKVIESVQEAETGAREWFPAEELFLSEQHHAKESCNTLLCLRYVCSRLIVFISGILLGND